MTLFCQFFMLEIRHDAAWLAGGMEGLVVEILRYDHTFDQWRQMLCG